MAEENLGKETEKSFFSVSLPRFSDGRCMGGVWEVYGRRMGGVWEAYGKPKFRKKEKHMRTLNPIEMKMRGSTHLLKQCPKKIFAREHYQKQPKYPLTRPKALL